MTGGLTVEDGVTGAHGVEEGGAAVVVVGMAGMVTAMAGAGIQTKAQMR